MNKTEMNSAKFDLDLIKNLLDNLLEDESDDVCKKLRTEIEKNIDAYLVVAVNDEKCPQDKLNAYIQIREQIDKIVLSASEIQKVIDGLEFKNNETKETIKVKHILLKEKENEQESLNNTLDCITNEQQALNAEVSAIEIKIEDQKYITSRREDLKKEYEHVLRMNEESSDTILKLEADIKNEKDKSSKFTKQLTKANEQKSAAEKQCISLQGELSKASLKLISQQESEKTLRENVQKKTADVKTVEQEVETAKSKLGELKEKETAFSNAKISLYESLKTHREDRDIISQQLIKVNSILYAFKAGSIGEASTSLQDYIVSFPENDVLLPDVKLVEEANLLFKAQNVQEKELQELQEMNSKLLNMLQANTGRVKSLAHPLLHSKDLQLKLQQLEVQNRDAYSSAEQIQADLMEIRKTMPNNRGGLQHG